MRKLRLAVLVPQAPGATRRLSRCAGRMAYGTYRAILYTCPTAGQQTPGASAGHAFSVGGLVGHTGHELADGALPWGPGAV